ncbi:MAG: Rieske (2Fe-2S) protein [Syntrophaceae bacterium]|nr:Rieske (2Fe-2S) protein [Syntrophaceae bacterium]
MGAIFSSIIAFLTPPRSALKKVGGWQFVGTLSEFKENSLVKTYFGLPVILIKNGKGLFSFSTVCPHLGCIVIWDEKKKKFICPCHDAAFDEEGKVLKGPVKPYNLLPMEIKVEGERISLKLPEDKLPAYPSWFRITMISGV